MTFGPKKVEFFFLAYVACKKNALCAVKGTKARIVHSSKSARTNALGHIGQGRIDIAPLNLAFGPTLRFGHRKMSNRCCCHAEGGKGGGRGQGGKSVIQSV